MGRVALLVGLAACGAHVELPPPAANLTPTDRVGTYYRYHIGGEQIVRTNRGEQRSVYIGTTALVDYPEDLTPLVGDGTATARHGENAATYRRRRRLTTFLGTAGVIVGAAVWLSDWAPSNIVGPSVVVSSVGLLALAIYYDLRENSEAQSAYDAFNADLASRLNVCFNGLMAIPCENKVQAPPPPSASRYYPSPLSSKPPPAP